MVVVGGHDESGIALGAKVGEKFDDFLAGMGIEVAGGFVGKDEVRLIDQSAGNGDALLLAAGQFVGTMFEARGEADAI